VLCTEIETQKSAPIYLGDTKAKPSNFAHSISAVRVLDLTENYFVERNWFETLTKSKKRELSFRY
jgi:hypothetical protein